MSATVQSETTGPLEAPGAERAGNPNPDACTRVVERVCESAEVRRAARLRRFLQYVTRRALEQPEIPITEQEIGVSVFDRQQDYDTGIDNIVRVNASELRKRITAYFANEGQRETVWFDIPRGSYTPRFFLREASLASAPAESAHSAPQTKRLEPPAEVQPFVAGDITRPVPSRERSLLLGMIAVLALICLALGLGWRISLSSSDPLRGQPTVRSFWAPVLNGPRATDVVLADTAFTQVEDMLGHQVPLDQYVKHTYLNDLNDSQASPEMKSAMSAVADRNYGSFGDFKVALRILSLQPHSAHVNVIYARTLEPPTLRTDHLVLIGSSYSNPWSSLFEARLNFVVVTNGFRRLMSVENRHPEAGEQSSYQAPAQAVASVGYSVVASLPGEDGQGETILIEGTSAEATEAAGDFLTSEDQMRHLKDAMQVTSLRHFEVLLRTTRLAATPLSAEIVAWRKL